MKTIGFENFSFEKYRISHVSVIRQKNAWTNLCHPEGRGCNGFILIINGECCYKWGDNSKNLSKGGLIYLPKGSRHSVSAPEKTLDFYRVNFTVEEISKDEEIIFSDEAKPISDKTPEMLYGLCEELCKATLQHGTDFKIMALLCEFINHCVFMSTPEGVTGFDAAIKKLNKSYTMPISIEALAEECFISPSHLFRLFKERLGMTPIEYKNSLRIEKAKHLLSDPECSISDIADMLGFENACYFTRIFKKSVGLSPMQYRQQRYS